MRLHCHSGPSLVSETACGRATATAVPVLARTRAVMASILDLCQMKPMACAPGFDAQSVHPAATLLCEPVHIVRTARPGRRRRPKRPVCAAASGHRPWYETCVRLKEAILSSASPREARDRYRGRGGVARWQHQLAIGLLAHVIPPPTASSAVIRFANLEPYKHSRLGIYLAGYMTSAAQGGTLRRRSRDGGRRLLSFRRRHFGRTCDHFHRMGVGIERAFAALKPNVLVLSNQT